MDRYSVPVRVGIWKEGVIINVKTEIREYKWDELDFEKIKWPNTAEMLKEKKFFGKSYCMKNEIVMAVIERWEEIKSAGNKRE